MDWSFLYEPDGINKFVDDLFAFDVLLLHNKDENPRILKMMDPLQLSYLVREHFSSSEEVVQMVVRNGKDDEMCPYFKVILGHYSESSPTNYKFECFLRASKINGIHARCQGALVIGMMNSELSGSCVSVPDEYFYTSVRPIGFLGPIDMTSRCSIPRKSHLSSINEVVGGVPGACLFNAIPVDLHWNIIKYLRHPCAEIIYHYNKSLETYWDRHFQCLCSRHAYMSHWPVNRRSRWDRVSVDVSL